MRPGPAPNGRLPRCRHQSLGRPGPGRAAAHGRAAPESVRPTGQGSSPLPWGCGSRRAAARCCAQAGPSGRPACPRTAGHRWPGRSRGSCSPGNHCPRTSSGGCPRWGRSPKPRFAAARCEGNPPPPSGRRMSPPSGSWPRVPRQVPGGSHPGAADPLGRGTLPHPPSAGRAWRHPRPGSAFQLPARTAAPASAPVHRSRCR